MRIGANSPLRREAPSSKSQPETYLLLRTLDLPIAFNNIRTSYMAEAREFPRTKGSNGCPGDRAFQSTALELPLLL